jgi:hypothetical protein
MMPWTDSRVVIDAPARVRMVKPSEPEAANRRFR